MITLIIIPTTIMILMMIDIAPFPPTKFKELSKDSQWSDIHVTLPFL